MLDLGSHQTSCMEPFMFPLSCVTVSSVVEGTLLRKCFLKLQPTFQTVTEFFILWKNKMFHHRSLIFFFLTCHFFFFQGWKRLCCLSLTAAVFTHLGVQPSVAAVRSHFCWTSSKDHKIQNVKCVILRTPDGVFLRGILLECGWQNKHWYFEIWILM